MASPTTLRVAILVVSTTASRDPSTDAAIPALKSVLEESGQWTVAETCIVSDDAVAIKQKVQDWTDKESSPVNLIVTTGGTGFAVSDITPEAVSELIEKPAPGLVHGMLAASLQVTPFAVMSRPVAGVRKQTVIVTLPGSPKGAKENLQAILKMLPHACVLASGMDSRALHKGGVKKLEKEAGVGSGAASKTTGHSHSHDHAHGCGHSHGHGHGHSHGGGHGHGLVRHAPPADAPPATQLSNDPSLGPTRRNRSSPYPMLSVDEALERIEEFTPSYIEAVRPVNEELVGHVLAQDVYAAEDVPAFRASIVDGYAVVVPDDTSKSGTFSGVFPVVAVSHAAPDEGKVLKAGEIARITTGAPLPAGANAVVMVENTVLLSQTDDGSEEKDVEIRAANVRDGDNVREVGSDVRKGQLILQKGAKITAVGGEVGLLASAGVQQVTVCRKPVVGVLSTGNEIVEHTDRPPTELRLGEVRDTNRPTLLLAAKEWGFETVDLGIAVDQPGTLEQRLRDALRQVDMIVTTGGVSMGELDLLKPTIERAMGGTIHFGRVAMKPGKPTTFATVEVKEVRREGTFGSGAAGEAAASSASSPSSHSTVRRVRPIFSLPGNPASALVTFHLFVLPALHKMSGEQPRGLPRVPVALSHDFVLDKERPEYHRAVVSIGADGTLQATSTGGQRSSKVGSMRGANALLCMPAGPEPLKAGQKVDALLMGSIRSDL